MSLYIILCLYIYMLSLGSCADILHSVKQFNNGFHESIISIILRDVIKATDYLHTLGYVHRYVHARMYDLHMFVFI